MPRPGLSKRSEKPENLANSLGDLILGWVSVIVEIPFADRVCMFSIQWFNPNHVALTGITTGYTNDQGSCLWISSATGQSRTSFLSLNSSGLGSWERRILRTRTPV